MKQEEKFEEAKKLYKNANADQRYVLEKLFPQLKESDDERIRKEIIKIFNVENFEGYNVDNAEAIEWLKKHKPAEWGEEDEKKRSLLISILKVNHPNDYFKVNPANTSNMEAMSTEELVDWLESLKERVHPQPKQEWSEEDEAYRSLLIQIMDVEHKNGVFGVSKESTPIFKSETVRVERIKDWLNSLKPQSTSEWSDADRENAKDICTLIDYAPWSKDFNKVKLKRWLRTIVSQKTERK